MEKNVTKGLRLIDKLFGIWYNSSEFGFTLKHGIR